MHACMELKEPSSFDFAFEILLRRRFNQARHGWMDRSVNVVVTDANVVGADIVHIYLSCFDRFL